MAGTTLNCCHFGASSVDTMHQFTVSLHSKPRWLGAVFSCTCTCGRMTGILYVLQRYHGGGTDTANKSQHRNLTVQKTKFSRRSCVDSNPGPFDHESGALTNQLSPLTELLRPTITPNWVIQVSRTFWTRFAMQRV